MRPPKQLAAVREATAALGFKLASDDRTGALLRTLAASKPGGRFLELGTGTGVSASWLLDGMDERSRLASVEENSRFLAVARDHLTDPRLDLVLGDGGEFIERQEPASYDFVFADAWAGKYTHFDETIALLRPGGLYVVDDLLPQPNWPRDHAPKVKAFLQTIKERTDLRTTRLDWGTGHIIAVRTAS